MASDPREQHEQLVDTELAQTEPMAAAATPTAWRRWLSLLLHFHRRLLAAVGLTLLLGFVVAVLAIVGFVVLAQAMLREATLALDVAALNWVQQFESPAMDLAMIWASAMGAEIMNVMLAALVIIFFIQRRFGLGVTILLATLGANLLNSVLKAFFARPRPTPLESFIPAQVYSFPSGHAMVSAAFYIFLAYLGWHLFRGWLRVAWLTGFVVLILAIGVSRMYLGVHYLTDVVAGYLAGFLWTETVIIGSHLLDRTWRPRRRLRKLQRTEQRQSIGSS